MTIKLDPEIFALANDLQSNGISEAEITNRRIAEIDMQLEALNKTRLEFLHKQIADRDETIKRLRAELARVENEMGLMR